MRDSRLLRSSSSVHENTYLSQLESHYAMPRAADAEGGDLPRVFLHVHPDSLAYSEARLDLLGHLEERGLEPLVQDILAHVDAVSLQSCRLVSRLWYCLGPTSHFHSLGQTTNLIASTSHI